MHVNSAWCWCLIELIQSQEPRWYKSCAHINFLYMIPRLDHKSCAESGLELMRPYLHEFLTSAYEDYDIVIWCMKAVVSASLCPNATYFNGLHKCFLPVAATSMKWIDAKMKVSFSIWVFPNDYSA